MFNKSLSHLEFQEIIHSNSDQSNGCVIEEIVYNQNNLTNLNHFEEYILTNLNHFEEYMFNLVHGKSINLHTAIVEHKHNISQLLNHISCAFGNLNKLISSYNIDYRNTMNKYQVDMYLLLTDINNICTREKAFFDEYANKIYTHLGITNSYQDNDDSTNYHNHSLGYIIQMIEFLYKESVKTSAAVTSYAISICDLINKCKSHNAEGLIINPQLLNTFKNDLKSLNYLSTQDRGSDKINAIKDNYAKSLPISLYEESVLKALGVSPTYTFNSSVYNVQPINPTPTVDINIPLSFQALQQTQDTNRYR